jgi:hypothetical protein
MRPFHLIIPVLLLVSVVLASCGHRSQALEDAGPRIVAKAYVTPDGGGYFLAGTGVTVPLLVDGHVVLPASVQGSHCSGFTLAVCLSVADEIGLTRGWSEQKLRVFQKQWFGVEPASRRKQMAYALEQAQIGREVPLADIMAGDFLQFNVGKSGHIAVVTNVITVDVVIVGINYRSSQPATDGVGDRYFFFEDTVFKGQVKRELCTVARLGR